MKRLGIGHPLADSDGYEADDSGPICERCGDGVSEDNEDRICEKCERENERRLNNLKLRGKVSATIN